MRRDLARGCNDLDCFKTLDGDLSLTSRSVCCVCTEVDFCESCIQEYNIRGEMKTGIDTPERCTRHTIFRGPQSRVVATTGCKGEWSRRDRAGVIVCCAPATRVEAKTFCSHSCCVVFLAQCDTYVLSFHFYAMLPLQTAATQPQGMNRALHQPLARRLLKSHEISTSSDSISMFLSFRFYSLRLNG